MLRSTPRASTATVVDRMRSIFRTVAWNKSQALQLSGTFFRLWKFGWE
jgi:hypothetical protein